MKPTLKAPKLTIKLCDMTKCLEAINFRALADNFQLNTLESKDAGSRRIIDVASCDSRSLSFIF